MRFRLAWTAAVAAAVACVCVACGSRGGAGGAGGDRAQTPASVSTADAASAPAADARPRIVVLGDSLTAGLGLAPGDAYPSLLQQRVDAAGLKCVIVNAGVSGDTSASGLSRLDWALGNDAGNSGAVRVLVVALGANDGLR